VIKRKNIAGNNNHAMRRRIVILTNILAKAFGRKRKKGLS
jgi:hypothetical protein